MAIAAAALKVIAGAGKAAALSSKGSKLAAAGAALKAGAKNIGKDIASGKLISKGSDSSGSTNVSSGSEISPMLSKMMEPMDRGFYGHMDPSKIKRLNIKGGQNA